MDQWLIKKNTDIKDTQNQKPMNQLSLLFNKDSIDPHEQKSPNDSSSDEASASSESRDIKIKNRKQKKNNIKKFSSRWLQIKPFEKWLEKSEFQDDKGNDLALCKLCKKTITAHKGDILRHSESTKHKLKLRQTSGTRNIAVAMINPLEKKVKKAEFTLCGLLATKNIPYSFMDSLLPTIKNIFDDSAIVKHLAAKRTKATQVVKVMGTHFHKEMYSKFSTIGNFFSLIMDETTDISSKKQSAFTIIYFSDQNEVVTRFFDLTETPSGTAKALYHCLKASILEKEICTENFIGFASDTTNVMVGDHESVFAYLKNEFPNIALIKCSCHMIHLSASKACLKLPRSVEDLLRNVGSHFSRSHLRQHALREFQEFFKVDFHRILNPSNTRWLSVKSCVDRVLEQWKPLNAYFRQVVFEDPSKTTEDIYHTFENVFTQLYFEFMSYTLGLLTSFNTLFQSETPLLHKLQSEVESLLKNVCSNFIVVSNFRNINIFNFDHTNPNFFVKLETVYVGVLAAESIRELKNDPKFNTNELETFYISCLQFYIELVSDIKKRFTFKDKLFEVISILDPKEAISFKIQSLNVILDRFPVLKQIVDIQRLDTEWREHALLDHEQLSLETTLSSELYWKRVFELKNSCGMILFPNLRKVISLLLVLPFSNASVERVFSNLSNIKTDQRNKLLTENVKNLLCTRDSILHKGGIENFNPDPQLLNLKIWKEN